MRAVTAGLSSAIREGKVVGIRAKKFLAELGSLIAEHSSPPSVSLSEQFSFVTAPVICQGTKSPRLCCESSSHARIGSLMSTKLHTTFPHE